MEIYNIAEPDNIRQEYSKFSGMRTDAGDVVSYFSPSGGGYGDPKERDPQKVLDDVLDDVGPSLIVGTLLPQQCSSTIMPKTRKHREDRLATRS